MLFGRKMRVLKRILIVEDEPLIAFDTEHFLRDNDFEIVGTVDRVAPAVALLGESMLDLILADINLNDGSGVDVARAAFDRGVPVLFVSGQCPVEARKLAVGCLAKPYPQRDLLQAIDAVEALQAGRPLRRLPNGLSLYDPV
ncbi:DNA-binding response OmpR family regulator [Sphingomonas zeicaulis]|uniref:response regulator n=1 Tax=Sphingomonas zeicaulis TaxID=1632740 RepID=UPI003D1CF02E